MLFFRKKGFTPTPNESMQGYSKNTPFNNNLNKNTKNCSLVRGSSLLEMVIYITISSVVIIVLISLLTILISTWNRSVSPAEVRQNASFVVTRITERIRVASAIIGVYPADTLDLAINGKTARFNVNAGIVEFDDDISDASPAGSITSASVNVSKCSGESSYFIKISNPPLALESVRFCLKISYNSNGDPAKDFSQEIRTTVSLR